MALSDLEDHGLPLVQLKEQRRELVVALTGHQQSVSCHAIMQIAALQQTIEAVEAVITDLDAELQVPKSIFADWLNDRGRKRHLSSSALNS